MKRNTPAVKVRTGRKMSPAADSVAERQKRNFRTVEKRLSGSFHLYPEPDRPIYYDRSGMVTNFNVSAIYLSWLVTKSMPYS